LLAVGAFSPSGMTASLICAGTLMDKIMIIQVLADHQILWPVIVFFAICVVRTRPFWQILAECFFYYENMFKNISTLVCFWVFRRMDQYIPGRMAFNPLKKMVVYTLGVPDMAKDIFQRFTLDPSPGWFSSTCQVGGLSTPALTKTLGNFLSRGILAISHAPNLLERLVCGQGRIAARTVVRLVFIIQETI
jgi:hypothetical protein